MIVMKFGGSSVKDSEALGRVSKIIEGRLSQRPVIVVSAFGKTTDALVSILTSIEKGDVSAARNEACNIQRSHEEIIGMLIGEGPLADKAAEALGAEIARLKKLIDGMESLGEVSVRSMDAVLATGEILAAPLLSIFLVSRGLPAEAVDPRRIIVTDDLFGQAAPILDETQARCVETVAPLLAAAKLPVIGGYVGCTGKGVITTLGRGGSDLTASVVARSLGAERLEYWKDVDGILTADPRIVPDARPVSNITFREAAELAFLGAKVLHPASIQPAVDADIPVNVLNSYQPDAPGTLISKTASPDNRLCSRLFSSLAFKRNQLLVNVFSTRMLGATGFLARVFDVFDRLSLSVDHIATSEVNVTVTLAPTGKIDLLKKELAKVANVDVHPGMGVVSVVGENLPVTPGVGARIFKALSDVNIKLVTYGGSGVNLSLVIEDKDVPAAARSLHQELLS